MNEKFQEYTGLKARTAAKAGQPATTRIPEQKSLWKVGKPGGLVFVDSSLLTVKNLCVDVSVPFLGHPDHILTRLVGQQTQPFSYNLFLSTGVTGP